MDFSERDSCGFGLIASLDDAPSHWVVDSAVKALERLTHRGAVAADGKSGDGCGLLLKRPEAFLRKVAAEAGIELPGHFAAGTIFLNPDPDLAEAARTQLRRELEREGLGVLGWREVPTDADACGPEGMRTRPRVEQLFVAPGEDMDEDAFRRALFVARRRSDNAIDEEADPYFYVCSLSPDTISYKALVMPEYLPVFYPDLADEELTSSVAVFHQRFSTNTLPQWRLAQPFRFLAHNGEINTIQGNRFWARARSHRWRSPHLPDLTELEPVVSMTGSDSCSLDNMLELLLAGGMDMLQATRLLIQPAWQNRTEGDPDIYAFYEFFGMHMEPWDGPAGLVMADHRYAACALDRNGLRPARFALTTDRHLIIASESGVIDLDPATITRKGQLRPGEMLALDTATGELLETDAIDRMLAGRAPYKAWLKDRVKYIGTLFEESRLLLEPMDSDTLDRYEKMFQLSFEERDQVIRPLADAETEAIGSMGDDAPLPVLSKRARPLYDYFRQQFAQVTNPPIDPYRERIVMSLETRLGPEANVFAAGEADAERFIMGSPVLSEYKFQKLMMLGDHGYRHHVLDLNYAEDEGLAAAAARLCQEAEDTVRAGTRLLVLSDRALGEGRLPAHALMVTGAIHHHLVDVGLRCDANIIVETATARDPHHFACLIGYGATAVYPYLAYECLHDMTRTGELKEAGVTRRQLGRSYRRGIKKGLYKIMSKMGISTVNSYRGAQLFEIVGLADEVVARCFTDTTSRVAGATWEHLQADQAGLARKAFDRNEEREQGGVLKFIHGGEYHAYNPAIVHRLQKAVRSGDWDDWLAYADEVNGREPMVFRDLLTLKGQKAIPLDEVEPIEDILPRFDSAGMSLGALSPEAHETLAIAMNRLGARSNSGEGGEDSARYGTERNSKIKQIASGRFGVTPHYLVNAEVLQIKMAQGAKPGEGGQLPGHKVNEMIATLRYSRPGVALISPPPHHDIYSIEDLAQLIFDLKQVNPEALVSVKLVSAPGVGTIAAGVTKAYADLITIAGYDGGTGASPLTSVKYAGSPWELGLTEAHQTLRANDLRGRVRLQADGGLKTGLDVVKAAILGAESFGFGTAPMVAMGCTYLRVCHLNNCTTGVATQVEELRKFFRGNPEAVVNYFCFVAQEARELMASLGVRSLEELIGRTDLLERRPGETDKQRALDLSAILSDGGVAPERVQHCVEPRNQPFDKGELAETMVREMLPAIDGKTGGSFSFEVKNFNRSIGARLSGEIAKRHGNEGMSEHPVTVNLTGTAGQSFGAWNAGGLEMNLVGGANDYVGKGMAGGKLVIRPDEAATYRSRDNAIMGNTCLYGATGGRLYAAGRAGERFAVRNSGAVAVIEGCGDHGCEYMTGGAVVVLGETGINFGAGMTGGMAFVLDLDRQFVDRYNHELVDIHHVNFDAMEAHVHYLRDLLQEHVAETGSEWSAEILDDLRSYIGKFWLVKPRAEDLEALLLTLQAAA